MKAIASGRKLQQMQECSRTINQTFEVLGMLATQSQERKVAKLAKNLLVTNSDIP
jgi:hypothetical protein